MCCFFALQSADSIDTGYESRNTDSTSGQLNWLVSIAFVYTLHNWAQHYWLKYKELVSLWGHETSGRV